MARAFPGRDGGGRSYVAATAAGRIAPGGSWSIRRRAALIGERRGHRGHRAPEFRGRRTAAPRSARGRRPADRTPCRRRRDGRVRERKIYDRASGAAAHCVVRLAATGATLRPLVGDANLDYRDYLGGGTTRPDGPAAVLPRADRVHQRQLVREGRWRRPAPRPLRRAAAGTHRGRGGRTRDEDPHLRRNAARGSVSDAVVLLADDGSSQYTPYFEQSADAVAALVPPAMSPQKIYVRLFPDNAAIRTEIRSRVDAGPADVLPRPRQHRAVGQKLGSRAASGRTATSRRWRPARR